MSDKKFVGLDSLGSSLGEMHRSDVVRSIAFAMTADSTGHYETIIKRICKRVGVEYVPDKSARDLQIEMFCRIGFALIKETKEFKGVGRRGRKKSYLTQSEKYALEAEHIKGYFELNGRSLSDKSVATIIAEKLEQKRGKEVDPKSIQEAISRGRGLLREKEERIARKK